MSQPSIAELERQVAELAREVQRLHHAQSEAESACAAAVVADEEWRRIFAALPDLVTIVDRDHRIVRINHLMAERLNLPAAEAIGRPCFEVMHACGAPPAFCPHSLSMEDGRPHSAEIYEPTLDAFFLVTASPFFDAEGRPAGSVHVARELPERRAGFRGAEATFESRDRVDELVRRLPRIGPARHSGGPAGESAGKTLRSK